MVCPQVVGSLDVRTLKPHFLEKKDAFASFATRAAPLALRGFLSAAAPAKIVSHMPSLAFPPPTAAFQPSNPQSSPRNPVPSSSTSYSSHKHHRTKGS